MWHCTGFGLLMPAQRPAHTVPKGDKRTLQVRARRRQDLDILRAMYMQNRLGPTIFTPDKDYEYRAYCRPEDYAEAMTRMIMEIDYTKFKPTTFRFEDGPLHSVYNRMWGCIRDLSTPEHRDRYNHKWSPPSPKPAKHAVGAGNQRTYGISLARQDTSRVVTTGTGYPAPGYADYSIHEPHQLPPAALPPVARDDDAIVAEVWADDVPEDPDSTGDILLDFYLDREIELRDELNAMGPIDHSTCEHNNTNRARERCRTRKREGLRNLIAYYSRLAKTRMADLAEENTDSDGPVTVVASEVELAVTAAAN